MVIFLKYYFENLEELNAERKLSDASFHSATSQKASTDRSYLDLSKRLQNYSGFLNSYVIANLLKKEDILITKQPFQKISTGINKLKLVNTKKEVKQPQTVTQKWTMENFLQSLIYEKSSSTNSSRNLGAENFKEFSVRAQMGEEFDVIFK